MVGLNRDGAPPTPPDPCSHFSTKLLDLDLQIRRWYDAHGDLLTARDNAKDAVDLARGLAEAVESAIATAEAPGSGADAVASLEATLKQRREDLIFAERAFNLASDQVRHYDREVPQLIKDRAETQQRLQDCEARTQAPAP